MYRFIILGAVAVLAAGSANCSRNSGNIAGPSAISDTTSATTAGKPGGAGSSSSLTLRMVTDNNGNGLPNWSDQVTFNVSTTATNEPHVDLTCTQNGVVVLGATTGFYDSYPWPWTRIMTLSSTSWQGGSADCTAVLYYFGAKKKTTLSTLKFTALQ